MKNLKKKHLWCLCMFSLTFLYSKAQKANNVINVNVETSIPYFQNDNGFGFYMRGLYGIGKSGQISFSAGISKFNTKNSVETSKTTTRVIPFLLGYKQKIAKFFVEPKFGFGELGGKLIIKGDYAKPSVAAIFGGLSAGYSFKKINVGINFLTTHELKTLQQGSGTTKIFTIRVFQLAMTFFPNQNINKTAELSFLKP